MATYKVANSDEGWQGYSNGDTVHDPAVSESDLAVLTALGVLVLTNKKEEV